ncbi:MAG: exodeoxyribonuclease VII small subunit [Candidatus Saccharimonadales bacterium]
MPKDINYKALRAELETIMNSLDDDTLDVDEVTKQYQRGMEIVKELETYLKTAENKVTKVKASFK